VKSGLVALVAVVMALVSAGCGSVSSDREVASAIEQQTGREVTSAGCEQDATGLLSGEEACGVAFADGGCEAWLATRLNGELVVQLSPSRVIMVVGCAHPRSES
jgi:hypothetical protein